MHPTRERTVWQSASLTEPETRDSFVLKKVLISLSIALGIFVFLACGGLWLIGFLIFAAILWKWGENNILPWMFFISVVVGALSLLGIQ